MYKYWGWVERVFRAGVRVGLVFFTRPANVAELSAAETLHGLSRNKHTISHATMEEIDVIRGCNVIIDEDLDMSPKRHNMGQFFIFEAQGNGSDLGDNFAKRGKIMYQNGVGYFRVYI